MGKINLFYTVPDDSDATSFYRVTVPLSKLRKLIPGLEIYYSNSTRINFRDLAHMDIVFLQRPYHADHLALANLCKDLKIKLWFDHDDWLFGVPQENPAYGVFSTRTIRENMSTLMKMADLVTYSTARLQLEFKNFTKAETLIVPNAYNDYYYPEPPHVKRHNICFWRGTHSHQKDVALYSDQIIKSSKDNPDWLFLFMGYDPWYLREPLGKNFKHQYQVDILRYHKLIREIYPNVTMVPLADNTFNRCKSNIAWIEATMGGSVTFAPKWDEWIRPGVQHYENEEQFQSLGTLLKENPESLKSHHQASWDYINSELRLSKVNTIRAQAIERLMS